MNETDRELLLWAAKAAGIDVSAGFSLRLNAFYVEPKEETGAYVGWNPIDDGGDALRLAVKLGIRVCPVTADGCNAYAAHDRLAEGVWEPHNNDPLAATRRAIVKAAAEIGRNMK